jgi:hypothetical protein
MAYVVGVGFPGCLWDSRSTFRTESEARAHVAWLIRQERDDAACADESARDAVSVVVAGALWELRSGARIELTQPEGYTECPCCGTVTMSGDLCDSCEDAGCELDCGDPGACDCPCICPTCECKPPDCACEEGV